MAIDPARIQSRMAEAELSGRPALGAEEAEAALCALAVVAGEDLQGVAKEGNVQPCGAAVAMEHSC